MLKMIEKFTDYIIAKCRRDACPVYDTESAQVKLGTVLVLR
jgi:hypothetical protein